MQLNISSGDMQSLRWWLDAYLTTIDDDSSDYNIAYNLLYRSKGTTSIDITHDEAIQLIKTIYYAIDIIEEDDNSLDDIPKLNRVLHAIRNLL